VDWRRGQEEEEDGEEENRWFFSFLDFDGKYIFLVDDKV
jgi:hypothetical protein